MPTGRKEEVIRILYDHYPSALSAVHASTSSARTGALIRESFFPFTLSTGIVRHGQRFALRWQSQRAKPGQYKILVVGSLQQMLAAYDDLMHPEEFIVLVRQ